MGWNGWNGVFIFSLAFFVYVSVITFCEAFLIYVYSPVL
jgi:hypothetical protein